MENSVEEQKSEQPIEQVASPQQAPRKKLALFSYLRFFGLIIKALVVIGIIILGNIILDLYALYTSQGALITIGFFLSILFIIIGLMLYVLYLCKTEAKNIYLVTAIILGLSVIMEVIIKLLMLTMRYDSYSSYYYNPIWIFVNDTISYFILIGLLIGILFIIFGLALYVLYLFNRTDKNKKTYGKKYIIRGVATIIISIFILIFFIITVITLLSTSEGEVHGGSFDFLPIPYSLFFVLSRMFGGR